MGDGGVSLHDLGQTGRVPSELPPAKTIEEKRINLETKVSSFFETNPTGIKTAEKPGRFDFRGKWDRFKASQLDKVVHSQTETNQIKHDLMQTFGGGMTHTLQSAWAPPVAGLVFLGTLVTVAVKGVCGLVSKAVAKLTVLATVSKEDRAKIAELQKEIKVASKEVKEAKNEAKAAFYKANNKLQNENRRIDKEISKCFKQINKESKKGGISSAASQKLNDLLREKKNLLESAEMKNLEQLETTFIAANNAYLGFEQQYIGTVSNMSPPPRAARTAENMKSDFFDTREKIIGLQTEGKCKVEHKELLDAVKPANYQDQVVGKLGSLNTKNRQGVKDMLLSGDKTSYYATSKFWFFPTERLTVEKQVIQNLDNNQKVGVLQYLGFSDDEMKAFDPKIVLPERAPEVTPGAHPAGGAYAAAYAGAAFCF